MSASERVTSLIDWGSLHRLQDLQSSGVGLYINGYASVDVISHIPSDVSCGQLVVIVG